LNKILFFTFLNLIDEYDKKINMAEEGVVSTLLTHPHLPTANFTGITEPA
jgi:hypothetical protein